MKSLFVSIVVSMLLVGSANAGILRELLGLPNVDDQRCQSYGFRPGTQGYANCRLTLEVSRQQRVRSPTNCTTALGGGMATTTCY